MHVIKLGFISILFFFLLITGFSLFIPSRVRISRAMNTGVVKDSLFNRFVTDLGQWKHWYPGFDTLPVTATRTEAGKIISGNAGETAIALVSDGDSLVEVSYTSPGKKPVLQVFRKIVHPLNDSVTVQWYMDFHLRWYPWEKFSGLMFEKRYGPRMEQGLSRLGTQAGK